MLPVALLSMPSPSLELSESLSESGIWLGGIERRATGSIPQERNRRTRDGSDDSGSDKDRGNKRRDRSRSRDREDRDSSRQKRDKKSI